MLKYEDLSSQIDEVIKWRLSLKTFNDPTLKMEDAAQILRRHICVKWHLWDQCKPLVPWVKGLIKNQLHNLFRNNYYKFAPPCENGCAYSQDGDLCSFTSSGKKCAECPMYREWEKKKKAAYNIRLASSIEQLAETGININDVGNENFDMERSLAAFHEKMKEKLSEKSDKLVKIYEIIYINEQPESVVSEMLGFQNNEKTGNSKRIPGYKIIFLYKQQIFEIAKKVMEDFDLIKI